MEGEIWNVKNTYLLVKTLLLITESQSSSLLLAEVKGKANNLLNKIVDGLTAQVNIELNEGVDVDANAK